MQLHAAPGLFIGTSAALSCYAVLSWVVSAYTRGRINSVLLLVFDSDIGLSHICSAIPNYVQLWQIIYNLSRGELPQVVRTVTIFALRAMWVCVRYAPQMLIGRGCAFCQSLC